jgi:hypothetical protein
LEFSSDGEQINCNLFFQSVGKSQRSINLSLVVFQPHTAGNSPYYWVEGGRRLVRIINGVGEVIVVVEKSNADRHANLLDEMFRQRARFFTIA